MKNLIAFILRYSTWFVFTFYVIISILLLVTGNNYQRSVYLTSANYITGSIYKGASQVTGYFNLKSINEDLQANNALLQNEVLNLKNQLAQYKVLTSDSIMPMSFSDRFGYVSAAVINNNTSHPKNFFTIDKGSLDGITSGMGVVDHNGITGIVNVTGPHMSRVISVLNESQFFSVKLKDTEFIGSLCWKGGDPTIGYVEEIPRHARYNIGDTIVTSGYSTTFPEGIPVGTVLTRVKSGDDSFFTLKIKLSSDFRSLSTVRVIKDIYKTEIDSLATFDELKPE
ncbi:MAG: rod shape-determining protein MreC [Muribaculaceae bacterium]|nr:rod shape-determining protein MreC [Muribaculaceae bacterium]